MRFCRSRNDGRRCTRELGHRGLHRHRAIMWADAGADALHCAGSGAPGTPAPRVAGGFPGGRALCPVCLEFVDLDRDGRMVPHDTSSAASDLESAARAEWFNTFGWTDPGHGGGDAGSGHPADDGGETHPGGDAPHGGAVQDGGKGQHGG